MSNQILTPLVGMKWPFTRGNKFSTTIKTAVSGREYRTQNWSYPKYEWKLDYEVLRETSSFVEMRYLMGFVNARGGSFDSFLYADPDDYTVTAQVLGTGDGTTTQFQLVRAWGGYVEPVYNLNGTASIFVNGVLKTITTDYTISAAGLVSFVAAPGAALPVTATFSFYWRVRFNKDGFDFSQMMQKLWQLNGLGFISTAA